MAKKKNVNEKINIKINKKNVKVFVIIGLVILIALAFYLYIYQYLLIQKKNLEIINYKRDLYTAVLCEYSCPMKLQSYQNKTQLLPDMECVKNCTNIFKQNNPALFTKEDLTKDNLLKEISNSVQECRQESLDEETLTINNTIFFSCTTQKLSSLKDKYEYL